MMVQQIEAGIADARSTVALDNLARLTWRGLAEGHIPEAAAERLGLAVDARRALLRGRPLPAATSPLQARRRPVSPDRRASLERRRRQAASGAMPPHLAACFTTAEMAVLAVVARVCTRKGRCDLPLDQIAALAGVCRSSARNALREARRLGLVTVEERRRPGRCSDTNIITITAPAWLSWLKLSPRGVGGKSVSPTSTRYKKHDARTLDEPSSPDRGPLEDPRESRNRSSRRCIP